MQCYAIQDLNNGLFYNRARKELTELSQNTAFYKTENEAKYELSFISSQGGTIYRIIRTMFNKTHKNYESDYYPELSKFEELHKNDFNLEIVKIEIKLIT